MKMIYEYLRYKDGRLRGVVVAIDNRAVGWSLCNKKDKFNKDIALFLAKERALKLHKFFLNQDFDDMYEYFIEIPDCILDLFIKMTHRSIKYFKYENMRA